MSSSGRVELVCDKTAVNFPPKIWKKIETERFKRKSLRSNFSFEHVQGSLENWEENF